LGDPFHKRGGNSSPKRLRAHQLWTPSGFWVEAFTLALTLMAAGPFLCAEGKWWHLANKVWAAEEVRFEIRLFEIEGNTVLSEEMIRGVLKDFVGPERTAEDVEKARERLEALYHQGGYPTVAVNIPEQTVEDGVVRLNVVEGRLGRIRVTGNRYVTREKILSQLESIKPGGVLFLPKVQEDLAKVNRYPDFKVVPALEPGKEPGTLDLELKVEDRLPLHGSLEINNRATQDTTELRLNAMLRYDNLWQKDHSASIQYQVSPMDPKEVDVLSASYVLPAPWEKDHMLALFALWSDSQTTASGAGFQVLGRGTVFGTRYVMPLPAYEQYQHNLTVGVDFKDFKETSGFGAGGIETPVRYVPMSFAYSASLPDKWGSTLFSAGMNVAFRGLVTDRGEFENKRYRAQGNYLYATGGLERTQQLPWGFRLFLKLDGQIADQPLIANEQYAAGGMANVRGYKESEVLADDAWHGIVELSGPDLAEMAGIGKWLKARPLCFYDRAELWIKEPLPGQDTAYRLHGAGFGVRGTVKEWFEYEVDWAVALSSTNTTNAGTSRVHFRLKYGF